MQVNNKLEIKLPNYEKCFLICDNDCSLGQLYDFSSAFLSFVLQKVKEHEEQKAAAASNEVNPT